MTMREVLTELAVVDAFAYLETREAKEQAWMQKHREKAQQGQGVQMEVPGMDAAGAWL